MGETGDVLLKVKNLTKEFSHVPVIENVNFELKVGDGYGVLGKSGTGKSVLMNCIRGIPEYRPTSGEVIFNVAICENEECRYVDVPSQDGEQCPKCGKTMHTQEVDYWNELDNGTRIGKNIYDRMSMMTQRQFSLYGELPVIENVMLALDDAGIPKHMQRPLAVKLLSQVKLTHRITHVARDLSGGENRGLFSQCVSQKTQY